MKTSRCIALLALFALVLVGARAEDATDTERGCSGCSQVADLASMYFEARPLIAKVQSELAAAKQASAADANEKKGSSTGDAIAKVLDSAEWDGLMQSQTLQRVSDELNLTCVFTDTTLVGNFDGFVASMNISESSDLYPVIKNAPEIAAGYYTCGGRIMPVMKFVEEVAPGVLKGEGFDPSSILASPGFTNLVASGFDMACFFGVPAVGTLLSGIMG